MHLIQYGNIFVKQNYFAHFGFINEQHRKLPLTTSRIANCAWYYERNFLIVLDQSERSILNEYSILLIIVI